MVNAKRLYSSVYWMHNTLILSLINYSFINVDVVGVLSEIRVAAIVNLQDRRVECSLCFSYCGVRREYSLWTLTVINLYLVKMFLERQFHFFVLLVMLKKLSLFSTRLFLSPSCEHGEKTLIVVFPCKMPVFNLKEKGNFRPKRNRNTKIIFI